MQYFKDDTWNSKSVNDLQGRNEIKANFPSGEECYMAQDYNTNTYAAGQWCVIKDPATGRWAILLELEHWTFSHFMPYNGMGMGTLGLYKTAAVAKQNARSQWPNARKVMPKDMSKPVYREYLDVL